MDRKIISQRIERIMTDLDKLKSTVMAMENTDIAQYSENYNLLATDAALRSELITCRLRHLIYLTTDMKKPEYLASAGVVQGIRIEDKNGILEVTLPCLMPKRKRRQSTEFLIDPLYFTLSQYSDSHPILKFKQCVVCFSHIYSADRFQHRVRDYDNLELKQILDVIATFIMEDDSGLLVDAYNTTEVGETDCTRISIMDKNRFSEWLKEREKSLKTISDF